VKLVQQLFVLTEKQELMTTCFLAIHPFSTVEVHQHNTQEAVLIVPPNLSKLKPLVSHNCCIAHTEEMSCLSDCDSEWLLCCPQSKQQQHPPTASSVKVTQQFLLELFLVVDSATTKPFCHHPCAQLTFSMLTAGDEKSVASGCFVVPNQNNSILPPTHSSVKVTHLHLSCCFLVVDSAATIDPFCCHAHAQLTSSMPTSDKQSVPSDCFLVPSENKSILPLLVPVSKSPNNFCWS
jgi:hypothetical protein